MFDARCMNFLVDLGLNNQRAWFETNKQRYEDEVRQPALAFIRAMAPHLATIAPNFVASDKTVGGSLMRVYRDTRFAKDKTPYKTNVGIHFRHSAGKDVHAPGYYLHIAPDEIFVGVGIWRPEPPALAAIRAAIDARPDAWDAATGHPPFTRAFSLGGDSARTVPRGFARDHRHATDLMRRDHIAVASPSFDALCGADGPKHVAGLFRDAGPYMAFLAGALDLTV